MLLLLAYSLILALFFALINSAAPPLSLARVAPTDRRATAAPTDERVRPFREAAVIPDGRDAPAAFAVCEADDEDWE